MNKSRTGNVQKERLQKVMARAGIASRRKCEELIAEGVVKVNGRLVKEQGIKVDPQKDRIMVQGKIINRLEDKIYLLMYKPRGYVTTLHDPEGRKTIVDLLKNIKERVFPVGRLDYDSEGLLLVTNDGELANALTHPRHEVKKTYLVTVAGIPLPKSLEQMSKGLELEDGMTAPTQVALVELLEDRSLLEITVHEGKNRLVRRMCEKIGHPVLRLKRIKLGTLSIKGVKPGQYRLLNTKEIRELKKSAGLIVQARTTKYKPKHIN
ncbi:pseudouridine synthase [Desulfofarcimen acetoxidans DSM 771]|uniref:Pseudouridine synthase n=1 Tax=Desulfofarcimen acetoxidans (strain ATCC 49208 / DSM 771 / KCTC 5769 / VKM B-1644 / 5575) TaxID=485916 RepID=C8VZ14_DESAS|nr:pseudouridine synthase [Desulfofarcimen acetoxidans]ACV62924.1 pseudouridine synthase [Desulfofarcimen acetoxidans DSM 771]